MDEAPKYTIHYRDVKHPRLEYKTGTLTLILPENYVDPEQILQKYQKWIGKKQEIISKALKEAKTVTLNSTRSIEELKILVNEIARMSQAELNTHINRIYFKKMKTKWASHSKNNNLTVNTLLKYLPEDLISYVIFHETAHSVERKHNTNFWELVKRKYPDYQVKEEKLLTYWFLIQEITNKQMTRAR